MNIFASFAQNLKLRLSRFVRAQEIGLSCGTLILIPNSQLPNKSSIQRKVLPTQKLTDSNFVYTNSVNTDISTTFQKAQDARLRTHPNEDRTSNQAVVRQMPLKQV
jgi:hypothetical protein